MEEKTIILVASVVTAFAAIVAAIATAVYTIFTQRLWTETKRQAETTARQAETAERQAIIAQKLLDAAHRPSVSVALYADVPTDHSVLTVTSVLLNHGNVPATITRAMMRTAWDGKTWAEGDQLVPTGNPSNMCIFPGKQDELGWGVLNPSFAPWPKGGWLRIDLEITYGGAFEERIYHTHVEASYPVPEGRMLNRAGRPMQLVKTETT